MNLYYHLDKIIACFPKGFYPESIGLSFRDKKFKKAKAFLIKHMTNKDEWAYDTNPESYIEFKYRRIYFNISNKNQS